MNDSARLELSNNSEQFLETDPHQTRTPPWGMVTMLEEGVRHRINRIVVKPGQHMSTQMHYHRSEHWVVVSGTARVICNGVEKLLKQTKTDLQTASVPQIYEESLIEYNPTFHNHSSDGEEFSQVEKKQSCSFINSVNSSIVNSPIMQPSKKVNGPPIFSSVTIDLINNKQASNKNISGNNSSKIKVNKKRSESSKSDNAGSAKSKKTIK